jgi:hypothetical protein
LSGSGWKEREKSYTKFLFNTKLVGSSHTFGSWPSKAPCWTPPTISTILPNQPKPLHVPHMPKLTLQYHPTRYKATTCYIPSLDPHSPPTSPPHPPTPQGPPPCSVAEKKRRTLVLLCEEEENNAAVLDTFWPPLLHMFTPHCNANLTLPLFWI